MFRRTAAVAASIASLLIVGSAMPAVAAGPPYVENWVDEGSGIAQEYYAPFCTEEVDFEVRFSFHDEGRFQLMERRGALYGQSTHHGEWTWWNPANGAALVVQVDGLDQDLAVTENADGTFTILSKSPAVLVVHSERGAELVGARTVWVELLIEPGPTSSPDDDIVTVVDVPKVSGHDGRPFCDIVADVLG
ncbi:hypothetical protein IF188_03205 [Microbacterium sp. NEAU-LLC]|uniref:Uncharacterized protein n=1 Tax=Microbacterium helvum TaxID=2773713 RepID=A0ABR8NNU7_9MICO|nr:hypothetical protein [Microbacterium helvum]MBD3940706.1 hypothetical protein [Microbacterium helvum]